VPLPVLSVVVLLRVSDQFTSALRNSVPLWPMVSDCSCRFAVPV
jgi:hypothetical protein